MDDWQSQSVAVLEGDVSVGGAAVRNTGVGCVGCGGT